MDKEQDNQRNAVPNNPERRRRIAQSDLEELKRVLAANKASRQAEELKKSIQAVELPPEEEDPSPEEENLPENDDNLPEADESLPEKDENLPQADETEAEGMSMADLDAVAVDWDQQFLPDPDIQPEQLETEDGEAAQEEWKDPLQKPKSRPQPRTEEERLAELAEIEKRRQQLRMKQEARQAELEHRQREQILERQAKRRQQQETGATPIPPVSPPPAAAPQTAAPSGQPNKIKKPVNKKTAPAGASRAAGTAKAAGAAKAAGGLRPTPAVKKKKSKAAIQRRNVRLIRIGGLIAALLVVIVVLVSAIRGIGSLRDDSKKNDGNNTAQQTEQTAQNDNLPASQQESEQYKQIKNDSSLPKYALQYPGMYSDAVGEPNKKSEEKVCYMTFDDGPSDSNTADILDVLKENGVKGTFFVVASEIDGNENVLQRIVDEGHTLCIHCNEHTYSSLYDSVDSYLEDFSKAYDKIYELTGYRVQGFRFPGGSNNSVMSRHGTYDDIVSEMTRRGFEYYDWNAYNHDSEGGSYSVEQLVSYAVTEVTECSRNDVILLMHDAQGKNKTVQALPSIIKKLQEEGIKLKAISNSTRSVHFDVNDNTPSDMPGETEETA